MIANPTCRSRPLSADEVAAFGAEIDALRRDTMASLGAREADYVHGVQAFVRYGEIGGRGLLMLGWLPPAWLAGTTLLSLAKIVENMELGHNVMHGQYDWMHDPALDGRRYEWDTACPGDAWRHSHNYMHHTYTNVEGKDRDLGYGILRLTDAHPWQPAHLLQPLGAAALALLFEWGVALHDLEFERVVSGAKPLLRLRQEIAAIVKKGARQLLKDYVFFPAIAGPAAAPVLLGNLTANLVRNVWAFAIIFCGHFTADVETFDEAVLADETRGEWYLRQLKGSSNLTGGPAFHFLSGNLSLQIEHHLFPDVPAVRYADMAEKVRKICARYGQHYNTGPFGRQFASVIRRIFRYSLPTTPSRATRAFAV
jgi:linoleoyl-CoA desaturase